MVKITKENILSFCDKYLFIIHDSEHGTSPSRIYGIRKCPISGYIFIFYDNKGIQSLNRLLSLLNVGYKAYITNDNYGNYARRDWLLPCFEVDKDSLNEFLKG